jgi:hypothetical protein
VGRSNKNEIKTLIKNQQKPSNHAKRRKYLTIQLITQGASIKKKREPHAKMLCGRTLCRAIYVERAFAGV